MSCSIESTSIQPHIGEFICIKSHLTRPIVPAKNSSSLAHAEVLERYFWCRF